MIPCLPQDDPDTAQRRAEIAENQSVYQFDFSYHDIGFAKSVPFKDEIGLEYMAQFARIQMALLANKAACKVSAWTSEFSQGRHAHYQKKLLESQNDPNKLRSLQDRLVNEMRDGVPSAAPVDVKDYEQLFELISPPIFMKDWHEDWSFAYQRLAGTNPGVIEGIVDKLPDHFPVTNAHYQSVAGASDSLEKAIAERRLYIADFKILDGIPCGESQGHQQYLCAPMALFAVVKPGGSLAPRLMPIAIQCAQKPGPEAPIFTPQDGQAWQLAKLVVQVADSNHHGVVMHLGYCHLVAERIQLSTWRTLADNHPVNVLLSPHYLYTLPNNLTTKKLILPGGVTPTLQSVNLDGAIELLKRGFAEFEWDAQCPSRDFTRRHVDSDALPSYPFRDDAKPVYQAVREWVSTYLRCYYSNDADVMGDTELQAWMVELQSDQGGRMKGLTPATSIDSLIDIVSSIINRVTTYHASINYSGFIGMGFAPNMPAAGYAPAPVKGKDYTASDVLKMLPPMNLAMQQLSMTYLLHNIRVTAIGDYPWFHFKDQRVMKPLANFRAELKRIEKDTNARNQNRPLPYTILLPSQIANSIQV